MQVHELITELTVQARKGALEANAVIAEPISIQIFVDNDGHSAKHDAAQLMVKIFPRPPAPPQ